MSAIVCGKRSFFEDLPTSPASASPPVSKKLRCSSSTSPVRISSFSNSPPALLLIDQLQAVFPNADKQLLEKALEESGNDLDSAIKRLHEFFLGCVGGSSGSVAASNAGDENTCRSGAEWVEVFVTEMMSASSVDDARSRAMRLLESLEKSISEGTAAQILYKKMAVKEEMEAVGRENMILKRAVAIQHERQKDYEERGEEVQQLKQMLSAYQEQLRTLEVNNYTLRMHLKQAQESNCMPGRFHSDVF